ncbi:MAG: hypothetical protein K2H97_04270 [Prevotella sp.]|nr:hypothetical protein [Prevotella sp.]
MTDLTIRKVFDAVATDKPLEELQEETLRNTITNNLYSRPLPISIK